MALTEKCPFFGLFGSLELDWAAGAKETRGATGEYLYCENRKRGDEVILAVDTNTIHEKMKNSRHRHRRHSIGPRLEFSPTLTAGAFGGSPAIDALYGHQP